MYIYLISYFISFPKAIFHKLIRVFLKQKSVILQVMQSFETIFLFMTLLCTGTEYVSNIL